VKGQGGFALISVLWIVALLALATLAALSQARRATDGALMVEDVALAQALADGAVMRTVHGLLAYDAGQGPWPVAEGVTVQDEGGLLDLNDAAEETLAALFRGLGSDRAAAASLAAAIADWRDEDQLAHLGGAEADAYRRAGFPHRPRDGLFETVDELRLVLGMTPELFSRTRPLLTVWGHRPEPDTDLAPLALVQALGGLDEQRARGVMALRPERPGFSASRSFGIRAVATTAAGGVFVREAVVRLTREPRHPVQVLLWRQGEEA
jgi:general secretion pathway protein K